VSVTLTDAALGSWPAAPGVKSESISQAADQRVPPAASGARSDVQFVLSDSVEDPSWDHYVCGHAEPHHEQTSLWSRARSKQGWRAVRLILRHGDRIAGGAQILERNIGRFGRIGYLARGPLLDDGVDAERFVSELKSVVRTRRLVYLAVSLPYFAHALVPPLMKAGFLPRPDRLPPSVWVKATVVTDLVPAVDTIFARLPARKRRDLRRGQREGVKVRPGTGDDLPVFEQLLAQLCARRGVVSNLAGGGVFLRDLWATLAPHGHIKLFLAEVEGEPVSALLLLVFGSWARVWKVGWSGRFSGKNPNEVIYWEAMCWAKENGCRHFDFLGIDESDARGLLEKGRNAHSIVCPITFFKTSFGGAIHLLPGEYCCFPGPLYNFLFRTVGQPLMASRLAARFFDGVYRRFANSA
jgi:lipid II:glycine glycyltransferase (peptidoglycan interpeptide bridge formation enzyme)